MTKIKKLSLVSILLFVLYILWVLTNDKKPIEIKPLKIEALNIKTETSSPVVAIQKQPLDILSKLKIASTSSKEGIRLPKEEASTNILKSLKNKIAQQDVREVPIKKKPVKPKKIVQTKVLVKKATPKRIVKKKIVTKKIVKKKTKPKKEAKPKLLVKIPKVSVSKVAILKKKVLTPKTKVIEKTLPKNKTLKRLSREEEVALYNKKYGAALEVVTVSESFEIQEEETLPDSYYFEPIKAAKAIDSNAPLEFVEKLGIVNTSEKYENNFNVPQKIEVAKEGIVTFTKASTKEMKNLDFVVTLGVINVSEDFETTEAKKYLE